MAGLSNFMANSETQQTTLPSWMDTAQQSVVNQATQGVAAMPSLQNTVAGQAINTLSGSNNPFAQAQGSLNEIATGAANPWITDASGNVTPNTGTAMGGLFQAQNQQLQQLAPNIMAPVTAGGTAAGQFGSLRTQTAADKALADAQANLFSDQMKTALSNQQTGVSAAGALGNVGQQGITAATNLGQLQQTDPALKASTLGKIIGGVQAPQTVTATTNVSPLNQIGMLAKALPTGTAGVNSLLGQLFPKGLSGTGNTPLTIGALLGSGLVAAKDFFKGIGGTSGTNPAGAQNATYDLGGGSTLKMNSDGTQTIYNADGSAVNYDANGNEINSLPPGSMTDYQNQQEAENQANGGNQDTSGGGGSTDTGGGSTDTGGGGLDTLGGDTIDTSGGNIDTSGDVVNSEE